MLNQIANIDYHLVKVATDLTNQYNWLRFVVYISAQVLIVIPFLALALLWLRPEVRSKVHGAQKAVILALMGVVGAIAVKSALSFLWFRERPFVAHPDILAMNFRLDQPSFPSLHALLSFTIATSLWMSGYHKLAGWLYVVAIFIILGRVFSGVHYPSDVLVGALAGWLIAWLLHRESSTLKKYLPDY